MENKIKDFEEELLALTKKHINVINKEFKTTAKKRPREEPKEEEEEEQKTFLCAGRVWEDPPTPCQGGDQSHVKNGTQIEVDGKKKNVTICHSCKLAKNRLRRANQKKNVK